MRVCIVDPVEQLPVEQESDPMHPHEGVHSLSATSTGGSLRHMYLPCTCTCMPLCTYMGMHFDRTSSELSMQCCNSWTALSACIAQNALNVG